MKNLCFIGDLHRRWEDFYNVVELAQLEDYAIVVLGDGGYGFADRKVEMDVLNKYNKWLQKRNCVVYNVRGNHDNPHWFMPRDKMVHFFEQEDRNVPAWKKQDYYYHFYYINPQTYADAILNMTNIKFVQDYNVIHEAGYNILCIGGAMSVDRYIQKRNGTYFRNEILKYNPIPKKMKGIDIVATHTAPAFAAPQVQAGIVLEYARTDHNLIFELKKERKLMTQIYDDVMENNHPKYWFYGHFHRYANELYNDTNFICLEPLKIFDVPVIL
jgi:hypothetical protein